MTHSIKILDCTLRDGGYTINWEFGEKTILSILNKLAESDIDYIECGFLKEINFDPNRTFFSSIKQLEKLILPNKKYTLMVNFGEYSIENFSKCKNKNIKIRVAFKKHNQIEALKYISDLKQLNWDVIANPMSTNTYSNKELSNLIKEINKINPFGVSIVDTLGNMYEKEVLEIFDFIDNLLNKNIALGFHSHNSMQLSFSNTKALLKMDTKRDIIIDSCAYGMGRGAGNLCTELITKYLNDNYNCNYKILPILKTIDLDLKPFYCQKPWGYSTPYYITAIHGCHPNYAGFLVEQNFSDEEIDKIIKQISQDKKLIFDKNHIEDLVKKLK